MGDIETLHNVVLEQEQKIKALEAKVHLLMREHYCKVETPMLLALNAKSDEDYYVLKLQNGEMNIYNNESLVMVNSEVTELSEDTVVFVGDGVEFNSLTFPLGDAEMKAGLAYLQVMDQRMRELTDIYCLTWHQIFVFHKVYEIIEKSRETVSVKDFYQSIRQSGTDITFRTVMDLVASMELESPDSISQIEFVELMSKCASMIKVERKWKTLFDKVDKEHSGSINKYGLIEIFGELGEETTKGDVDEMMDELNIQTDNDMITFDDFKRILLG